MQTIILCGGKGTRMREETEYRPKPLVEIGGKPILWHIMKLYAHHGHNEFILSLGYKGQMIRDYFGDKKSADNFIITFVDTGEESLTGERVIRARPHLKDDVFMITYGDGVGDIPIDRIIEFHRAQGTVGTITGSHPFSKWGLVKRDDKTGLVTSFKEKPRLSDFVNSGFMVFDKQLFDYLDNGPIEETLVRLGERGQLSLFEHNGFWKAMDTQHEMQEMNALWEKEQPWAVWEKILGHNK